MSLIIGKEESKEKVKYPRIGEGLYPARLVQVIGLGWQVELDYKTGNPAKDKNGNELIRQKVYLTFELPTETIEVDGEQKPRWISKEYTLSFFEKAALVSVIKALSTGLAKPAESLDELLTQPCMVQIGSTSGDKDKIINVTPPMKGMSVGELVNKAASFDPDDPDSEVYDKLPQFLKDKIDNAVPPSKPKVTKTAKAAPPAEFNDDDIPF